MFGLHSSHGRMLYIEIMMGSLHFSDELV